MDGIVIRYRYDGDEDAWRDAVATFIRNIDSDAEVKGKFSYSVNVAADGKARVHIGRWTDQGTLETLQSRDYFKAFAAAVKGFAGDTLDAERVSQVNATGGS